MGVLEAGPTDRQTDKRMTKTQLSPHKYREIYYGAKVQISPEELTIPSINAKGIKFVQSIVVAVLFYGRAVDNKLVVSLNAIGTQHASAAEIINEDIDDLLDYLDTYPNNGIVYRARNMVLASHSDARFRN